MGLIVICALGASTFGIAGCSRANPRRTAVPQAAITSTSDRTAGDQAVSPTESAMPSQTVTPQPPTGSCKDRTLSVSYQPDDFQATGDRGQAYRITNGGSTDCFIEGYPHVAMRDRSGAVVPFKYTDGQSQYVTSRQPERVTLQPGQSAYVGIAKYRCDPGSTDTATTLDLVLPGQRATVSVTSPTQTGVAPTYEYCKGGPTDPGNTVAISPVELALDHVQR
jgi:hypothetical protein